MIIRIFYLPRDVYTHLWVLVRSSLVLFFLVFFASNLSFASVHFQSIYYPGVYQRLRIEKQSIQQLLKIVSQSDNLPVEIYLALSQALSALNKQKALYHNRLSGLFFYRAYHILQVLDRDIASYIAKKSGMLSDEHKIVVYHLRRMVKNVIKQVKPYRYSPFVFAYRHKITLISTFGALVAFGVWAVLYEMYHRKLERERIQKAEIEFQRSKRARDKKINKNHVREPEKPKKRTEQMVQISNQVPAEQKQSEHINSQVASKPSLTDALEEESTDRYFKSLNNLEQQRVKCKEELKQDRQMVQEQREQIERHEEYCKKDIREMYKRMEPLTQCTEEIEKIQKNLEEGLGSASSPNEEIEIIKFHLKLLEQCYNKLRLRNKYLKVSN